MENPGLSYVLAHPTSVGMAIVHPVVLIPALAAPFFFFWRSRAGRRAAALRSSAFVALALALAGLRFAILLPADRLTLVAAVDVSESIDRTGREWAKRYVNEVAAALAPGDELAVLTFAGDTNIVRPPGPPAALENLPESAAGGATDLRRAIDSAMALFAGDGHRRLLLVTDGNETRGHSARDILRLREAGIRVDVAVPPHGDAPDVRLQKLIAAPIVAEESVAPLRAVVRNGGKVRPAVLTVYLDGEVLDSTAVELQPGLNLLDAPIRLIAPGSHRLRASLEVAGDPGRGSRWREVGITVRGKTRTLLVTARAQSPVALALKHRGVHVDVSAPEQLPRIVDALLAYNGVVFEDVTAGSLPPGSLASIEHYVREFGGGFVLAGGALTYGDQRLADTPLKRLLPVTLEPHRPRPGMREPLALFIVIDRSNSMGYNSTIPTLRDGEKLRYAKEAALAVIRQLKDEDLLGVIAFDSQPHELSPLKPLHQNRSVLESLIPQLIESGGTDFYDALVSARQQLAASRVKRRHIVLLTDGDTNRSALDEYRALIGDLAAAKISLTTIRVGDNTVNLRLLQELSERTGGAFHYVRNAQMLPDLMLRDATRALGSPSRRREQFYPRTGSPNQLLQGIDEQNVPPLADYAYAKPKDGAEVLLYVSRPERRDPILAVWQYGLGRVAAYTASPSDDAEQWMGWPEFGKFWSQLLRWTAREQTATDYAIDVRRQDGAAELTVRTFNPAADHLVLLARLHLGDGTTRDVSLVPREPRRFTAPLPDVPAGRYPLTIIRRGDQQTVSEHRELVTVPAEDTEPQEEQRRSEPNLSLLIQLTEQTGGTLNPSARAIAEGRRLGNKRVSYRLDDLLLPFAMVLFLADIAVRRLRWEARASVGRPSEPLPPPAASVQR